MRIKLYILLLVSTLAIFSCLCEGHEGLLKSDRQKINIPVNSIPINYQIGDLIKVPIIINDSVYSSFILDNGTNYLTFDSSFVAKNNKSLRLSFAEKTMVRTFTLNGVIYQKVVFPIPDITIGTTSDNMHRIQTGKSFCVVGDLKTLSPNGAMIGILPMGLLRDKRFLFVDLTSNYIQQLDTLSTDEYQEIPFTIDPQSGVFLSKLKLKIVTKDTCVSINGDFAIDFGFNGSIYLNRNPEIEALIGIDGDQEVKISIFENYSGIGERLIFKEFPEGMSSSGFIGLEFLRHFKIIIDYKSGIMYLKNC